MHISARSILEIRRAHVKLLESTQRAVAESLKEAGRHAVDHVKREPGFKPKTGALQKSTKARVVRTAGGKLLKVANGKRYAASIDKGARPHVIVPKRRKFLRFRGRNGQWVFARKVNHPGNKPYHFLRRATKSAALAGKQDLQRRLTRIASRF